MKIQFDNGLATPDSTMKTTIFKSERYEIIKNKDNQFMIVGMSIGTRECAETVYYNSPRILYDLILLYYKSGIKGGFRTQIESQLQRNIDKIAPLIIDFCKEYGLPYYGNIGDDDIFRNCYCYKITDIFDSDTIDYFRKENVSVTFCNLSMFLYWLKILYGNFLRFITMTNNDDVIESFEIDLKINLSVYKKSKTKIKDFFPVIVNHFSFESFLQRGTTGFFFQIVTYNVFHLAVYYFCLICVGGVSVEKTLIIKPKCKLCGSPFITTKKQSRYCPYCSPQKAWNAKHR